MEEHRTSNAQHRTLNGEGMRPRVDTPSESPGSTPLGAPNKSGRLNLDAEALERGLEADGREDRKILNGTPLTDSNLADYENDLVEAEFARALELRCRSLAMIFPKILEALGNGSACVGEGNSIEFLQDIPNEVRLVVQGYQRRCRSLEAALESANQTMRDAVITVRSLIPDTEGDPTAELPNALHAVADALEQESALAQGSGFV